MILFAVRIYKYSSNRVTTFMKKYFKFKDMHIITATTFFLITNCRHQNESVPVFFFSPTLYFYRGGSTWQPQVVPTGVAPKPSPLGSYVSPVTKTSLAAKPQDPMHIGSGHNNKAKPFASVQVRFHKLYNS